MKGELALLEEIDDLGPSSSIAQEQSWRASAYLGDPIDATSNTDTRKQFQNLVHMWAETGESSISSMDGKVSGRPIQRRRTTKLQLQLLHQNQNPKDSEPYVSEHPDLWEPDKPDRTVTGKGILAALTKFRQPKPPKHAVFSGDLDQTLAIAEQEEPEWKSQSLMQSEELLL
jgi:hypothetical protein